MTTITQYFEQAQLSLAAYATGLQQGMSYPVYVAALKSNNLMTATQAATFASTYTVVDQYTDALSGFSATVFVDSSGVKHLATRGTQTDEVFASAVDWLAANAADVAADGIAISQGIELINYLQRLYGVQGSSVVQYGYNSSLQQIYTTTGTATGELSGSSSPMSVTGHSLGGQLAMMASRLAPGLIDAVYTFNAPGFDTALHWLYPSAPLTSEGFFSALNAALIGPITGAIGASWNAGIMTHLDVSSDVVHSIGSTPGTPGTVFSEQDDQLSPTSSHSITAITDSLAVYNLLAALDPSLNTASVDNIGKITNLLKAASNVSANSLEYTLDALRTLLQTDYTSGSANPLSSATAIDNREAFYANLNSLIGTLAASTFNLGTPQAPQYGFTLLTLNEAAGTTGLAEAAKTDLATRYALYKGNTFVLDATGYDLYTNIIKGVSIALFLEQPCRVAHALN